MSEATTDRAESVNSDDFITQYIPLQKAGKTREEIASEMGMKIGSFNTKLSTLATEIYAGTCVLAVGEGDEVEQITGETLVAESTDDKFTLRKLRQGIDRGDYTVVQQGVKLPMPKNSRSKRNLSALGELAAKLIGSVDADDSDSEDETAETGETVES